MNFTDVGAYFKDFELVVNDDVADTDNCGPRLVFGQVRQVARTVGFDEGDSRLVGWHDENKYRSSALRLTAKVLKARWRPRSTMPCVLPKVICNVTTSVPVDE